MTSPKSGFSPEDPGARMISLAKRLWPISRSLSGPGVRSTLGVLKEGLPDLEIHAIASGTSAFDWITPQEWSVESAYIIGPDGKKFCDYEDNNLHLMGYSEPFEGELTLEELNTHLHSIENQPDAIPYVTSYYKREWGFCLSHANRNQLHEGTYTVSIKSRLESGVLNYGELVIPGNSNREILFSTYVCHPSMANNELSGPVLAAELASEVRKAKRHYTYRFLFLPETIGSIAYLSQNIDRMKSSMLAGFVLTCVGDERAYSYLPSRSGSTVADKSALRTASKLGIELKFYSWLERGSDERQYCSPGVDLPVCSVMRSKHGSYPEYHTSLDQIGSVVTARGLGGSLDFYKAVIDDLESKRFPKALHLGEPQMGRRNLYPHMSHLSRKGPEAETRLFMDFLSYSDGTKDLNEIADLINLDNPGANRILPILLSEGLVSV